MSLQSLEAALAVASQLIRPGQAHFPLLFEEDGATPTQRLPHWLIDPVRQEIEGVPELQELGQRWLRNVDSGIRLQPWHIARAQVYRLFANVQPSQIVADLCGLARRKTCETWVYIGLYGGGVADKVELAQGVDVMPAVSAPPSFARELIFGVDRWGRLVHDRGFQRHKPNVALLISVPVEIFTEGLDGCASGFGDGEDDASNSSADIGKRIRVCAELADILDLSSGGSL